MSTCHNPRVMTRSGMKCDESSINRTRLKDQLMQLIPSLCEDKYGREVVPMFDADVKDAVYEAYSDLTIGMCIARATNILRRDLFK